MKKVLVAFSITFLAQTTVACAETDWTPFLEPMLSGCSVPILIRDLPTHYESSIISQNVTIDPKYRMVGYDGDEITTYNLKDAVAFRHSLLKVEYQQSFEGNQLKLYFEDTKFTTLRPQFQLPEIEEEGGYEVTRNNSKGYDIKYMGYVGLELNNEQKSIACYGGA